MATLMGKSVDYLATLVAIWRIGAACATVHRIRRPGRSACASIAVARRASLPTPSRVRSRRRLVALPRTDVGLCAMA